MEIKMDAKTTAEQIAQILIGNGNKNEKRKIIIRAIKEDQVKFLNTCKERWGEEYYSEIVADC